MMVHAHPRRSAASCPGHRPRRGGSRGHHDCARAFSLDGAESGSRAPLREVSARRGLLRWTRRLREHLARLDVAETLIRVACRDAAVRRTRRAARAAVARRRRACTRRGERRCADAGDLGRGAARSCGRVTVRGDGWTSGSTSAAAGASMPDRIESVGVVMRGGETSVDGSADFRDGSLILRVAAAAARPTRRSRRRLSSGCAPRRRRRATTGARSPATCLNSLTRAARVGAGTQQAAAQPIPPVHRRSAPDRSGRRSRCVASSRRAALALSRLE